MRRKQYQLRWPAHTDGHATRQWTRFDCPPDGQAPQTARRAGRPIDDTRKLEVVSREGVDERKREAAAAALNAIQSELKGDTVIGIGTGSTANHFIDLLADKKHTFDAAVSSSEASTERLTALGIEVVDPNAVARIAVYVDGADEVADDNALTKGAGAALTREKILAASADDFVCIVDDSKLVDRLGRFPLPVEVIPAARSLVARALVSLGGEPVYRDGVVTDNGTVILDVHNLVIDDPDGLEREINNVTGVVCNGIFAANRPSRVVVATAHGIETRSAT